MQSNGDGAAKGDQFRERAPRYWRRFAPYVRPHARVGILSVVLMLTTSLLTLPSPLITKYIIDEVLTGRSPHSLVTVGLVLVALLVLMSAVGYFSQVLSARFRERVVADVEVDLFGHACSLPYEYHISRQPGYLASRIGGDVQSLQGLLAGAFAGVLGSCFTFLVGVVAVLILETRLGLMCLVAVPLYALIIRFFVARIRLTSQAMQESMAKMWGVLHEGLGDVLNVKLLRAEAHSRRRVQGALETRISDVLKNVRATARYGVTTQIVSGLLNTLILVFGGRLVLRGEMSLGGLIAFISYIGFVFNPIRTVADMFGNLQVSFVCMDRILEIMAEVPEGADCDEVSSSLDLGGGIRVRGLEYRYPDGRGGVSGVDLDIGPGEKVALVGRNGSGKTTAALALVKLFEPQAGRIEIGGRDASRIHPQTLRHRIVMVPQQATLFQGTIRDNLTCGREDVDAEAVARACRVARIEGVLAEMPSGLDTDVGYAGAKLSGGERQRVALARALLGRPALLILDETTSEMDAEAEGEITAALSQMRRECSILLIAHRLASVRDADRIYVFDAGAVIASGTHEDLAGTCPLYRDLCERQDLSVGGRSTVPRRTLSPAASIG